MVSTLPVDDALRNLSIKDLRMQCRWDSSSRTLLASQYLCMNHNWELRCLAFASASTLPTPSP